MEDLNLFTLHCTLVKNAYTISNKKVHLKF